MERYATVSRQLGQKQMVVSMKRFLDSCKSPAKMNGD